MRTQILVTATSLLFIAPATAQDTVDLTKNRARTAKLQKACAAMAGLQSLAFTTKYKKTKGASSPFIRGLGKQTYKSVRATGSWHQDQLFLDIGNDEQLMFHGRRMIAKDDDHEWSLRRGRRANGKGLPLTLDPAALFASLANANTKVVHHEVGTINNRPVETYTITLDERAAQTLLWSGSISDGSDSVGVAGAAGAFRVAFAGGVGIGRGNTTEVSIDLAISFDPATSMIHRIKGRTFIKGGGGMPRGVIVGAGGLVVEAEDDDEDEEEDLEGSFKDGLPVRAKKEIKKFTVVEFTYAFTEHNKAAAKDLDARARTLLGLPH